jgi:hypothetical protein
MAYTQSMLGPAKSIEWAQAVRKECKLEAGRVACAGSSNKAKTYG